MGYEGRGGRTPVPKSCPLCGTERPKNTRHRSPPPYSNEPLQKLLQENHHAQDSTDQGSAAGNFFSGHPDNGRSRGRGLCSLPPGSAQGGDAPGSADGTRSEALSLAQ